MKCRHCSSSLHLPFLDLGSAPASNAYLTVENLKAPELWYPLRLLVCESCWLVQTEDHVGRESLFSEDYAYFSSFSSSWLAHAQEYVRHMLQYLGLDVHSLVVEVASNDGYLLQYVQEAGIPCYGIEPAAGTAKAATAKGISIVEHFFGVKLARELASAGKRADLIVANNVLAHVPDINDFVGGFSVLLKPHGIATFEFPHLLRLVAENQFDTVYHEHYSYLSLTTVERIFSANGLAVYDVEPLSTHGGSLRVFSQRRDTGLRPRSPDVDRLLEIESTAGILRPDFYAGFQAAAEKVKNEFLAFLVDMKCKGRSVAAYGAAAKGNTLLNFAGVRPDLLPYVVDRNPAKQGRFLPGSRIPILKPEVLSKRPPDFLLILPWNIADEIQRQNKWLIEEGTRFVAAVPKLHFL